MVALSRVKLISNLTSMDTLNEKALIFMKSHLRDARIELSKNEDGRKAVDFVIRTNNGKYYQLYFKFIHVETERSIKIPKHDLGELNNHLLIGLVLLIESKAKVLYLIPSTVFLNPNSIFKNNNLMLEHLSNWEIRVFTNAIPELSKYSLENMSDKL